LAETKIRDPGLGTTLNLDTGKSINRGEYLAPGCGEKKLHMHKALMNMVQ
jgi:hypothetical protein